MRYIHKLSAWPKFHWNDATLAPLLGPVRHRPHPIALRLEGHPGQFQHGRLVVGNQHGLAASAGRGLGGSR